MQWPKMEASQMEHVLITALSDATTEVCSGSTAVVPLMERAAFVALYGRDGSTITKKNKTENDLVSQLVNEYRGLISTLTLLRWAACVRV